MPNIKDRTVSITVSLPARIEHAVYEQAEVRGISRSEVIADLLIRALEAERIRSARARAKKGD